MPIKLTCPSCHKNLTAPDETAGRVLKCPYCQDALTVPVGPAPPPVSPRPASPSFEPSAGPSPGRPTSFDSESPFGETVKPFPRRTHAAESPAITKTEHERIIDYFSAQGCLARFLFAMDDETYKN